MSLHRLVLWRHGETDYNLAGRLQGHFDSSLTGNGHQQAMVAAEAVGEFEPDVAISSDLHRARSTISAFSEVSGVPAALDKRLRETNVGDWQGLSGAEIEHSWPGAMTLWRSDATWAPPGGESRVEVAERALSVVTELDLSYEGTALLCTHGGLITSLTARLLELPVRLWPSIGGVGNCHWVVLVRRDRDDHTWRLMTYNHGVTN